MKDLKETQKETYNAFIERINKAGLAELEALDKKTTKFYDLGLIDEKQLSKLDTKIMHEMIAFKNAQKILNLK